MPRRKLELWIADLRKLAADPTPSPGLQPLALEAMGIRNFATRLATDAHALRALDVLLGQMRAGPAAGRQVAEEEILGQLAIVARHVGKALEEGGMLRVSGFAPVGALNSTLRAELEVLHALHDLSRHALDFVRPRESFAGRRRALSYRILSEVGVWVDLPDLVARAIKASGKSQSAEALWAGEFVMRYSEVRDAALGDQVDEGIGNLLDMAASTPSEGRAAEALGTLVDSGVITEAEAADRMGERRRRRATSDGPGSTGP